MIAVNNAGVWTTRFEARERLVVDFRLFTLARKCSSRRTFAKVAHFSYGKTSKEIHLQLKLGSIQATESSLTLHFLEKNATLAGVFIPESLRFSAATPVCAAYKPPPSLTVAWIQRTKLWEESQDSI